MKPPRLPGFDAVAGFPERSRWNEICLQCHSTHGRPRIESLDPPQMDTQVSEMGIACEACHGPGSEHVRLNQDPTRRYRLHVGEGDDPSAVDPMELDARRSTHVCGQCHGVTSHFKRDATGEYQATSEEAEAALADWSEHGSPYRPGDDLRAHRHVMSIDTPDISWLDQVFWSDGQVRVSGREYSGLRLSPCWPEIACTSCHEMHPDPSAGRSLDEWRDDQLKPGMRGDLACRQCHEGFGDDAAVSAHTHHPASSSGSRCMNCHMPYTTYGLLKAIRSHQIDSPSVAASVETGRPNACNQCHLDRSLGWANDQLAKWYGAPKVELSDEQRDVSAAIVGALSGDAGQRALWAWSLGWGPAHEASGDDWQAVFLAQLLLDPYDAVRYVAQRSLRQLPGFADLEYDFVAPAEQRAAVGRRIAKKAQRRERAARPVAERTALLQQPDGKVDRDELVRWLRRRDDRQVILGE